MSVLFSIAFCFKIFGYECECKFNTHSIRIGAATSAFVNEISEEEIKKLGRWSSKCFERCIRIN